jgi:hypothetical protein
VKQHRKVSVPPIADLGFSKLTSAAIERAAVRLGEPASTKLLLSLAAGDLLSLPGFGRKALAEVEDALGFCGLRLRRTRRLTSHHAARPLDDPADCGETREPSTAHWPNVTCPKCLSGRTTR